MQPKPKRKERGGRNIGSGAKRALVLGVSLPLGEQMRALQVQDIALWKYDDHKGEFLSWAGEWENRYSTKDSADAAIAGYFEHFNEDAKPSTDASEHSEKTIKVSPQMVRHPGPSGGALFKVRSFVKIQIRGNWRVCVCSCNMVS